MQSYHRRLKTFIGEVIERTPFIEAGLSLLVLWLLFSLLLWLVERTAPGTHVESFGEALYWSVAAFSTAGIADAPATGAGRLIGGTWIVVGSVIFFSTVVGSVTAYFMRPMQRPVRNLIDTIENSLENLDELSVDELELLRSTADGLIEHMERIKQRSERRQAFHRLDSDES